MLKILFLLFSFFLISKDRIITIGGGITEIVIDLGKSDKIIASDFYSIFDEKMSNVPRICSPDSIDAATIISLNPDLVILFTDAGPESEIKKLKEAKIKLYKMGPLKTNENIRQTIKDIGKLLGRQDFAIDYAEKIQYKYTELEYLQLISPSNVKCCFIKIDNNKEFWVAGGNTSPDQMIDFAGGINSFAKSKDWVKLSKELLKDEKFYIFTDVDLNKIGGKENLKNHPIFADNQIILNENYYIAEYNAFLGFGPRTPDSIIELSALLMKTKKGK